MGAPYKLGRSDANWDCRVAHCVDMAGHLGVSDAHAGSAVPVLTAPTTSTVLATTGQGLPEHDMDRPAPTAGKEQEPRPIAEALNDIVSHS